jgi:hypothetical protein
VLGYELREWFRTRELVMEDVEMHSQDHVPEGDTSLIHSFYSQFLKLLVPFF